MLIQFGDLLKLLPAPSHLPPLDEHSQGVRYLMRPNDRFVEPKLNEKSRVGDTGPSVLLISARGAAGKTTLAEAIGHQTGAALWNLAEKTVARDSFVGAIANAFGAKAMPGVLERLERGDFLALFDALDETRVGSGEGNFDDFLKGMSDYLT
jgi:hypothetical protein